MIFNSPLQQQKKCSLGQAVALWSVLMARDKEATDRFLLRPKTSRKLANSKVLGVGALGKRIKWNNRRQYVLPRAEKRFK